VVAASGIIAGFVIDNDTASRIIDGRILQDKYLAALQKVNPDILREIERRTLSHIQDVDNPHNIKLATLLDSVVEEILSPMLPGSVPSHNPSFVLDAGMINASTITTSRSTPITIVDSTGYIKRVEPNEIAVDYTDGKPAILVWPRHKNTILNSRPNENADVVAIGGAKINADILVAPDTSKNYISIQDNLLDEEHGCAFPIDVVLNEVHTTSFYISTTIKRYITISLASDQTRRATFDTLERKFINISVDITPHATSLLCGWYRLGITYRSTISGYDGLKICAHSELDSFSYSGLNTNIFSLFGVMHGDDYGMAPYIETIGSIGVCEETIYTLTLSETLPPQFTLSLDYATDSTWPETNILSLTDVLKFIQIGTENNLVFNGTIIHTVQMNFNTNHISNFAFSYSQSEKIMSKHSTGTRLTNTLSEPISVTTNNMSLGPFPGRVYGICIYPYPDDHKLLEFLTGEMS
jgi:hypothetical protein